MSFLSVSRLPFARPETSLQARKRFSPDLATFLDTALPSPITCPFLAFRDCRLPGRKPLCRPGNAFRQLWPHFWTQPCLAKPCRMSFLSACPFLAFRDCRLPGRKPLCRPGKRFSAALATFNFWTQPCLAKPRHMSFLSVSGHSLALQSPVTCPFLAFRDCRVLGRKPLCRPGTALPCKAPSS